MLVHRAALDRQFLAPERDKGSFETRGTVDDDELRPHQAAGVQVVEKPTPGCRALSAHVLDGKQDLLPIPAHVNGGQHRDVRGLSIRPGLDDGAVQDQPDNVLVDQAAGAPGVPVELHLAPPRLC